MRKILTVLSVLVFVQLKAQHMKQPTEVVLTMFKSTDNRNWNAVESCFSNKVVLDYSSMGNPAANLTPSEITSAWKTILPGFTATHHQIGNLEQTIDSDKATVFAYGTATHFLQDEKGNVWTVVGTYDFELEKTQNQWKISKMVFNFKYQNGNTNLPQKAINKVAGKVNDINTSEKNIQTVKDFFKALENENANDVANLFSEEGKQINPYHSNIFPKGANGKAEIKAYWAPVFPNFNGMQFHIEEIHAMENTPMVYVKYKGNIKLKNSTGIYSNNYYSTFKFNNEGKITEYVEIFNPITAAKGFDLIDKIK